MSKQPEALRLADALNCAYTVDTTQEAAAELRRLHEENERLKAQQQEPYGQVTVVRRPGCVDQHWFYRWPEPPYLDNAAECHMVYTSPQPAQPAQPAQQQCNPHPKAPHGFDRNSSHSADRYVCDCEGWDAYDAGYETGFSECLKRQEALDRMAENARELGLDYEPIVEQVEDSVGIGHGAWDMVEPKELAKAFHEALAEQPAQQQEPVAWYCKEGLKRGVSLKQESPEWEPLYTAPTQRKPLSDDEADELVRRFARYELIRAIEAAHGIKD